MKRRNLLIGLGGAAGAGGLTVGTGAFTSVSANRDVEVAVADDPNALLGIQPCPESANADYATFPDGPNGGGILKLDLSPSNGNVLGEGVNDDAVTVIHDVFRLCNQGTQEACVWVDLDPLVVDGQPAITFYFGDDNSDTFEGPDDAVLLEPGECTPCIGLTVDTTFDWGQDSPLNPVQGSHEMVVHAHADDGPCFEPELPPAVCGQGPWECSGDQGLNALGGSPLEKRSDPTAVKQSGPFSYPEGSGEDYTSAEIDSSTWYFYSLGFDESAVAGDNPSATGPYTQNTFVGGDLELWFPGQIVPSDDSDPDLVVYEATNSDRNDYPHEMAQVYATSGDDTVHVGTASSRGPGLNRGDEPSDWTGRNEFQLPDDHQSYDSIIIVDDSDPSDFSESDTSDGFDVEFVETCTTQAPD